MILSNLENDGSLAMAVEGQTKTVTMLTDTSTVPYNAYYDMPDGYATWFSIAVVGNLFTVTANDNLFGEAARSKTVRFWCLPTAGGTLQSLNVTVTQAADTVSVTFDPASVSLAYTEGDSDTVTLAGVPVGAVVSVEATSWITASVLSPTSLSVAAALNESSESRTGSVVLFVNSRPFYLTVVQAANTLALTFNPTSVSFGATDTLTDDVTVTGVPTGEEVVVATPEWVDAAYADGTLTLTADSNALEEARSGSVEVLVCGKTFYVPVSQAANLYPNGKLTLSESSHTFAFSGGTLTVSASEMPVGETLLLCEGKPAQGNCVECGNTGNFVTFERVSDTSFKLTVAVQDIFDGIERVYVLKFSAGSSVALFTVTQAAPPSVYRFGGIGDKFLKVASSLQVPAYLAEATALELNDQLKVAGWTSLDSAAAPLLIGSNRDTVPTNIQSFEAYKVCFGHKTLNNTAYHKVAMGAAAYRFIFKADAYGLVLRGLRFKVKSDAYCANGLRVALETSSTADVPSADWAKVRDGTGGNVRSAIAARALRESDNLYYGSGETVVFDGLNITISASTRLYLYITLEDYKGVINGWIYGSGIIAPSFDFYANALSGSLEEGDRIAEASASEEPTQIKISVDGDVSMPKVPEQSKCSKRELAYRDLIIGSSQSAPTPAIAQAALPALFATTAEKGLVAANLSESPMKPWQERQLGLSATVSRQLANIANPLENKLRYSISPLVILTSLPVGFAASLLRLHHRAGDPAIATTGADIRLSVYWFAAQNLGLEEIGDLAALPAFSLGGTELVVGERTGTLIGNVLMPVSIAADSDLAVPIGPLSDRWGTLLIVPWIARITATEVALDAVFGLPGPVIGDGYVTGAGWMPNVYLEV